MKGKKKTPKKKELYQAFYQTVSTHPPPSLKSYHAANDCGASGARLFTLTARTGVFPASRVQSSMYPPHNSTVKPCVEIRARYD